MNLRVGRQNVSTWDFYLWRKNQLFIKELTISSMNVCQRDYKVFRRKKHKRENSDSHVYRK